VIRSFGQKAGVDFDRVHTDLIAPALQQVSAEGGTTGEIVEAGNVREDMFRELVLADVVVADVSVHNANVFYELGIRHAARSRATVLIRARIDEVPFDLKTDRYLSYDPVHPAAAVTRLVQVLRETLANERADSPVFQMLPGFTSDPQATLFDLPRDLREEIERAREAKRAGDLRLIADEVVGLRFEEAALRAAAQALEYVGDDAGAQRAWERVRAAKPADLQANRALSDVYRRLGELVSSDQAIERALGGDRLSNADRAELYALRGSNSKRRWVRQWREVSGEDNRAQVALRSRELEFSFQFYRRGFEEDLNHWYSGLNALALAKCTFLLARRYPDDWRMRFDNDAEAATEYERLESEIAWLTSTVRAALDTDRARSRRSGKADFWLDVSAADLRFLTSDEPERVKSAYEAAMHTVLGAAARRSIREQLLMFRDLGVLVENATPTLALIGGTSDEETVQFHPLVFSGHMIDAPGRPQPRFPLHQEDTAAKRIEKAIREIVEAADQRREQVIGMAAAADGGDLLFHEACQRVGIPTQVFLPVPELLYRATALSHHASRWADHYHAALRNATQVHTLAHTDTLPGWLLARPNYSTWQRHNRWILHHAWATTTTDRVTLLALWNGHVGDGPGGVADMVVTAQASGATVVTLDTTTMSNLPEPDAEQYHPNASPAPSPNPVTEQIIEQPSSIIEQKAAESDGDPVDGDPVLEIVWRRHRQWSQAADAARSRLDRWRQRNLLLLSFGALAGALAAQSWLSSTLTTASAVIAAVMLALAGLVQGKALAADQVSRWTGSRAASEALKTETYRYLARVKPYDNSNRAERLKTQLDAIQSRVRILLVDQELVTPDSRPLPRVRTFGDYLIARAQQQADWHRNKAVEHANRARQFRIYQLIATIVGAILASAGGVLPGSYLASWTAAATTIAAAIGTHLTADQHKQIAASYTATAGQLDRLIAAIDPATASPERQARFVTDVEQVLAAQNNGWVELLSLEPAP
jgi:hypothetical protein